MEDSPWSGTKGSFRRSFLGLPHTALLTGTEERPVEILTSLLGPNFLPRTQLWSMTSAAVLWPYLSPFISDL